MKISIQSLQEKRKNKENVFLITGGTGFLGSHIAFELLKKGYHVVLLCRPGKHSSAQERIDQLLNWFCMQRKEEISKLDVVEGFIDRPDFGLTNGKYDQLLNSIDEIIHCAASTTFSQKKKAELETVNIKDIANILKFASHRNSKCYYFHHMSTAYVAGKKSGNCDENLFDTNEFHNMYEETKYRGEQLVLRTFPQEGIRVTIYRPSIVYGNSRTGRTIRFNALYYPFKMALFLKSIYEKDIKEKGGKKAQEMGVKIEDDGSIYLPIRMESKEEGMINLIPVDYFTKAFIALMEECLDGDIFHIVSSSPKKLEDLIHYAELLFKIKGVRAVLKEDFKIKPATALETLFNGYLEMYEPYLRDTRRFNNRKAEAILQKRNIICPDFDFAVFSVCMNYALSVDWGKKLTLDEY